MLVGTRRSETTPRDPSLTSWVGKNGVSWTRVWITNQRRDAVYIVSVRTTHGMQRQDTADSPPSPANHSTPFFLPHLATPSLHSDPKPSESTVFHHRSDSIKPALSIAAWMWRSSSRFGLTYETSSRSVGLALRAGMNRSDLARDVGSKNVGMGGILERACWRREVMRSGERLPSNARRRGGEGRESVRAVIWESEHEGQ